MNGPKQSPAAACLATAAAVLAGCESIMLEPSRVPSSIEIEPEDLFINEGEIGQLRVIVLDQNGREMSSPPTWAPPRWNITNALTIHPDGRVEGHEGGFNNAIASVAGHSAAVTVRVQPDAVALSANTLYINQAAQNRSGDVPLIAGRPGLLRAFVLGDEGSFFEPVVRAVLYLDGEEVHTATMSPDGYYLPTRVEENRLDRSYNAVIPGEHIQPGLEIVLDMDVNGVVPLRSGSSKRWPASGRVSMNVVDLPTMELMIVPTILSWIPSRDGAINWSRTVTTTSNNSRLTRSLRPVADFEITVHETFTSDQDLRSGNGWSRYLNEITLLRSRESHLGYYYGAVQLPPGSAYGGLGWIAQPAGVGANRDAVMAHELGHNMNLRHAPCGGAGGPDPAFPYGAGDIGIYGYNVEGGRLMGAYDFKDDMSYCDPTWVSDYHFARAIQHRLDDEPFGDIGGGDRGLRISVAGSVTADGIDIQPSYVFEGAAITPDGAGPYELTGYSAGAPLFSYRFTPSETGNGWSGFHFSLPFEEAWGGELDEIRVSGPAGEAVLAHNSAPASAIVVSEESGQVTAITSEFGSLAAGSRIDAISAGLPITSGEIR